jgi:ubiquinone/menaquinone biosynthesis C-methylase UbiE
MIFYEQPYLSNPILRLSYSLIAPLYDAVIERPMREARKQSLRYLPIEESKQVLISGVGTGLDLPFLPRLHRYTALDFNSSMLMRAKPRSNNLEIDFVLGDSMALPFGNAKFDHVVLHLIVAVVSDPERCLIEASRVLKPGGKIILFDKFLHPQRRAPMRRLFNGISVCCKR